MNGYVAESTDTYTYDAAGNRLQKHTVYNPSGTYGTTSTETKTYTYDKNNRLLSQTSGGTTVNYTYDNNGNMLTDGTKMYTYNVLNQLINFRANESAVLYTYTYDPLGMRSKKSGGVTREYVYDGGLLLFETTLEPNRFAGIVYNYGYNLISSFHNDQNISYRALYVLNARGDVIQQLDPTTYSVLSGYAYDAFGEAERTMSNGTYADLNPFRYCGEYYDAESGLIYLRARYYNPELGRFINEDPIRDGLNWYVYCGNNPIMFVDPWGMIPSDLEAAYISQHVYEASEEDYHMNLGADFGGWKLDYIITNNEGLKIGVYYRTVEGVTEYILANKGSSTIVDWKNNFQQPFGDSADMEDSIRESKTFVENHASSEITMVGHSKGGAEAVANAVATNTNCIVFNPATTFLSSYGMESAEYTANMSVYVVRGEVLNMLEGWFSTPIDSIGYLSSPYPMNILLPPPFDIAISIKKHSMDSVIWGLKKGG